MLHCFVLKQRSLELVHQSTKMSRSLVARYIDFLPFPVLRDVQRRTARNSRLIRSARRVCMYSEHAMCVTGEEMLYFGIAERSDGGRQCVLAYRSVINTYGLCGLYYL